jgi:hypothetical protein
MILFTSFFEVKLNSRRGGRSHYAVRIRGYQPLPAMICKEHKATKFQSAGNLLGALCCGSSECRSDALCRAISEPAGRPPDLSYLWRRVRSDGSARHTKCEVCANRQQAQVLLSLIADPVAAMMLFGSGPPTVSDGVPYDENFPQARSVAHQMALLPARRTPSINQPENPAEPVPAASRPAQSWRDSKVRCSGSGCGRTALHSGCGPLPSRRAR